MQQYLRGRFVFLTLTVVVALAVPSLAARRGAATDAGSENTVARAKVAPHLVSFEPLVDYQSMTLTVSGDEGLVFRSTFAAGTPIVFDLFDQEGNPLQDGTYTYELQVSPKLSAQVRGLLESARLNGTEAETETRLRGVGVLPRGPMAMSGVFTLKDGAVADPDLPEAPLGGEVGTDYRLGAVAPQDIIHNDDVIITFSLCVGTDCANGENFGFDTIRLKENNLRIRAFDTSNSSSFPTRDWQIVFNDSGNGGADKFAIDDIDGGVTPFTIRAGAPSNSLFVDAQGDVGLNTSNPVVELHIVDGDSPTLRLEQNGSSGFTAQTWDLAGNETNFFVRDVTNGSTLPLRIRPGAPSNSIFIGSDGDVGIGTGSPVANGVTIEGGSANEAQVKLCHTASGCGSTSDGANFTLNGNNVFFTNRENGTMQFFNNNTLRMTINNTGVAVTGDLSATGAKPFITPDPTDPTRDIRYVAMEGPEAALFVRGSAQLVGGKARIELPAHFTALAVEPTMTVTLTPRSASSLGLAAVLVKSDHVDVTELANGAGDYTFDYVVYAVRSGYENYPVYLPKN